MKKVLKKSFNFALGLIIVLTFIQCKDAKDAALTKILDAQVKIINDQCPIQLSDQVCIDSCKVIENMTLKTYATMFYMNASDFKADEFEKFSKPGLVYTIQTNQELKLARESGVIFVYSYSDRSGNLLGEITVSQEDYNKPIDESNKGGLASLSDDDLGNLLQKSASGIKSHIPMDIDDDTQLIDCSCIVDEKILEYVYCLKNKNIAKFDSVSFKNEIKPNLVEVLSTDADTRGMLDLGVTFSYIYKDKNGKYLCRMAVSSSDI